MIAVNIVGYKKTGKTTLAVALGQELARRGVRAAAAKFTHQPEADAPGTDSHALRQAYGRVALLAGEATGLFWQGRRHLPDLVPLLDADVLVVEGGKHLGWLPRILLLRSVADAGELEQGLALASAGQVPGYGLEHVPDVSALADLILARGFALPGLDCGSCGRPDCAALAREIVAGKATAADCRAAGSAVEVTVNGQPLAMNAFVQGVFSGAVTGMLRQFKGYAPGTVEIRLKG
ncbi:molybdopterin-guanine dinucleotide biosynthesis protein MobB [Desulfocurvus vexinensis]|uniref:molybdopterin-guanine dinucleotide biosynthesis protein MobB n=1 Tax=Desulfocurvus vexinensis TaxID=399548 RepID=UPI000490A487|nr:molybdopterin-guanine dinucleotide biosynthesis protein MobB [Desulfocurvus vexinensis]